MAGSTLGELIRIVAVQCGWKVRGIGLCGTETTRFFENFEGVLESLLKELAG
jgi:hypothetical protein